MQDHPAGFGMCLFREWDLTRERYQRRLAQMGRAPEFEIWKSQVRLLYQRHEPDSTRHQPLKLATLHSVSQLPEGGRRLI